MPVAQRRWRSLVLITGNGAFAAGYRSILTGHCQRSPRNCPRVGRPAALCATTRTRTIFGSRLVGRFECDYRAGRFPAITPGSVPSVHQSGLSATAIVVAAASATSGRSSTDVGRADTTNPRKRSMERSLSGTLPDNTCVLIILAPHSRQPSLGRQTGNRRGSIRPWSAATNHGLALWPQTQSSRR